MKQNKRIPRLRFPDFENSGEWEEKALNEVSEINPSIRHLPGLFIYIDLESVVSGNLIQKKKIKLAGAPSRAQRLLHNHDILFQMVRPYQKNNYYFLNYDNIDYVASTGYAQIRANESSMFLYQFIHTDKFVLKVLEKCTGSNYPAINSSDLSKILVQIPTLSEQQKIASILSSLDELITAETDKLAQLQTHKKGLMQNIFPQEGEKVPKLRFKEFENEGEWEEKKLGEIGNVVTGNTPSTKNTENYGGDYLFVSPADISNNRYLTHTKTTLTKLGYSKTRPIKENSILFVCIGSTIGKVAQNQIKCATNQQINSIIPYQGFLNDFVFSSLENNTSDIIELAGIQAVPIINKTLFSSINILIPSLPEQQKIADTLSSLDNLITAQTTKIDLLKEHKKGLMQGLFPG